VRGRRTPSLTLPTWLSAAGPSPRRRRRYVAHATALKIPRSPTAGRDRQHGLRMQQFARKFDAELSFEA
jgi:hypothetical protein